MKKIQEMKWVELEGTCVTTYSLGPWGPDLRHYFVEMYRLFLLGARPAEVAETNVCAAVGNPHGLFQSCVLPKNAAFLPLLWWSPAWRIGKLIETIEIDPPVHPKVEPDTRTIIASQP